MELKPEIEQLVQEEIRRGRYHSVDEAIEQAFSALREKQQAEQPTTSPRPRKRIYELLTQPPFAGSELNLERHDDYPRPIDL